MAKSRILVVDDELGMLEVCAESLAELEAEVVTESDSERGARLVESQSWDLVIADVRMPTLGGIDLLRMVRRHDPEASVLMITAFPNVETAVECMKLGAADYLAKPFLPEDLLATAQRLLDARQLRAENTLLMRQVDRSFLSREFVGASEPMKSTFELIKRVAPRDTDVLILGETGTGKEVVARCIHELSDRKSRRFVPVDCGAIPEDLIESELFGHERGAFTGATSRSLGLMEFADGGTFFLDEIGELSASTQAKLLRALQERKIRRVGGTEEVEVNVRVIAATVRNLDEDIKTGRFRSDLYYRINVARIDMPPLRERNGDVALLANHFVQRYAAEMGLGEVGISADAMEILSWYPWPGNVRELQNVIKRTLALIDSNTITDDDLPDEVVTTVRPHDNHSCRGFFDIKDARIAEFEKAFLSDLLSRHDGDATSAAREAQIPRGTLYRLLKKHGLNAADFRP